MADIRDDKRNPGSQTGPYGADNEVEGQIAQDMLDSEEGRLWEPPTDDEIAEQALRALRGESDPLRGRRVARDPRDFSEAERSGYEGSSRDEEAVAPETDEDRDSRCTKCGQDPCACSDVLFSLHEARNADGWFHGDEREIWNRIASLESALAPVRQIIDSGFGSEAHVIAEAETEEELRTLRSIAGVYSESVQEEFLENLPGGTVAMDYGNLIRGGVMDPGFDDGTPLYAAARDVAREASRYNWDAFATRGAREWLREKVATSPGMLEHQMVTRHAAVDYARDKTMVIMDPVRRAAIVDAFVTEAERARRDEVRNLEQTTARRHAAADRIDKTASATVQGILDEEGLDWM